MHIKPIYFIQKSLEKEEKALLTDLNNIQLCGWKHSNYHSQSCNTSVWVIIMDHEDQKK